MSQRDSGYQRKDRDLYETPEWVTEALLPHLPPDMEIWEPACGSGKMSRALAGAHRVIATDIHDPEGIAVDFLAVPEPVAGPHDAIITNPPYKHAVAFIERSLAFVEPTVGIVAMLLGNDFDHAKTRQHLFSKHPAFAKKLVLTKRIKWFDELVPCKPCRGYGHFEVYGVQTKCKKCGGKGKKKQGPSENHAWFIWHWGHNGPPILAYGP